MGVFERYSCDMCYDRHMWSDIHWITSSFGLYEKCYDKFTDVDIEILGGLYE